jgi:hypothetical protein
MVHAVYLCGATQADHRPSELQAKGNFRQGPVTVTDSHKAKCGAGHNRVARLPDPCGDWDRNIAVRVTWLGFRQQPNTDASGTGYPAANGFHDSLATATNNGKTD